MSAFFVATVTVKNPEKFQEYGQNAGPTFAPYGGELITKGKYQSTLVNSNEVKDHSAVAIVKFPSQEQLDAWYHSAEYQAIIPLRDEAADITIATYAIPA